jgi:hypothetical protein
MGIGGKIIIIFTLTLFFTAGLISYFQTGFYGSSSVKIIELPKGITGYNNGNNFVSSCNISEFETEGSWSCSGSGLSLTDSGSLRVPLVLKSQDGIYDNTYHITSHDGDFTIIVADTKYGNYVRLKIKEDGIHIPDMMSLPVIGAVETGDKSFYPFDGTIQDMTIHTNYDINNNVLNLDINGQQWYLEGEQTPVPDTLITPSDKALPYIYLTEVKWTTGIISDYPLTIASMDYNYQARSTEVGAALDGLAMVINLAYTMLKLCTYTFPYDVLPLVYQFFIVFPQEFCLLMGVAIFLREG